MNTATQPIRIVVTVETRIYRDGIAQLLDNYSDIEVVATTSGLQDTIDICLSATPQILLLDVTLPGTLSTVKKLKQVRQDLKIVLLSMTACRSQISVYANEGVLEFVTREDSVEDLYQSIIAATKNGFFCSSRVAKMLFEQETPEPESDGPQPLTKRQFNVLQLLESGKSNKEIARRLHIEIATVKNHVHQILQKLEVRSRGEAAALYRRVYGDYTAA